MNTEQTTENIFTDKKRGTWYLFNKRVAFNCQCFQRGVDWWGDAFNWEKSWKDGTSSSCGQSFQTSWLNSQQVMYIFPLKQSTNMVCQASSKFKLQGALLQRVFLWTWKLATHWSPSMQSGSHNVSTSFLQTKKLWKMDGKDLALLKPLKITSTRKIHLSTRL